MRSSKVKIKRNLAIPGEPMSQEEFVDLIKEAEKGPFKPLGSFDEFKNDVLNAWKRKCGK
jgi:Txe/YoeB family toxin of Txe-Axe toxin-antitoxin module